VTDKRGELRICDVIRSSQSLHSIASYYHSFVDDRFCYERQANRAGGSRHRRRRVSDGNGWEVKPFIEKGGRKVDMQRRGRFIA